MAFLNSLLEEKSRRIMLILYALTSVLPILLVIYICLNYVVPELNAEQIPKLSNLFIYSIGLVTIVPLVSFFLISRMANVLEKQLVHSK